MDSTRCYYVRYRNELEEIEKLLPTESNNFMITRSLFERCDSLEDINLKILFRSKQIEEDYMLTDSMHIIFIPMSICE